MDKFISVLKEYWGYETFRPLQDEIIHSIGSGRDTLGLMPTGGGKSLTFQVPTMAMDGLCLVVTPLIALMKDQVSNLQERGIKAVAIYAGLDNQTISRLLDNCIYGDYKFLYVSPERLSTTLFLERLPHLPVCLIAVDESHCISQWGYDFRPSYLHIADIRGQLPNVPVLALTATATPDVVDDIQDKLKFRERNVFRQSFARPNLAYVVRRTEDKNRQLLKILQTVPGTSVVYVRNRKRTREVAEFLQQNGIFAEHFHAGLSNEDKDARQVRWKTDVTRVIVATNAFGMGIDKPDVRTVVHLDLPDTLEAYFQEAGRAGRDRNKAYAVLLYNDTDAVKVKKRIADNFPDKEFILRVYDALGNYFQVGAGSGLDKMFAFDMGDFCQKFHFPVLPVYGALKILQQAGYLELTDEQDASSLVMFKLDKNELYSLHNTELQDNLIKILLRSYTGMFAEPARIHEETIAQRMGISVSVLHENLLALSKGGVISYIPRRKTPYLVFLQERELLRNVVLSHDVYEKRKERYVSRLQSVLEYAQQQDFCRSQLLLSYFGEQDAPCCGVCDVCLSKREHLYDDEYERIRQKIISLLQQRPMAMRALLDKVGMPESKMLKIIRLMQDEGELYTDESCRFIWNGK